MDFKIQFSREVEFIFPEDYEYHTEINQKYLEVICNIVRKQNIKLIRAIAEEHFLPEQEMTQRYVCSKSHVINNLYKISQENN